MKFFFFAAMTAVSFSASASPFSFRGVYAFKGTVLAAQRQTVDVIDTRSPDAQTRMEALRRGGAQCSWVNSSTVRCLSYGGASSVPAASIETLRRQNQGLLVEFGQSTGTPSIVTRGTDLIEWNVPQIGKWKGGAFTGFRYLEMTNGLAKLVLPGSPEALWLNTTDGRQLKKFDSVTVPESRWRWHQDYAEVVLTL